MGNATSRIGGIGGGFVPGDRERRFSFDDLVWREIEREHSARSTLGKGRAVHGSGGIDIAGRSKSCYSLASRLNRVAEREMGAGRTKAD
jgi:hypothetical protein